MWITTLLSVFGNKKNLMKIIGSVFILITILYFVNDYSNLKESKIQLNKDLTKKDIKIDSLITNIYNSENENKRLKIYYENELDIMSHVNSNINIVLEDNKVKTKILYKTIYKDRVVFKKEIPGENLKNLFENLKERGNQE